jgi:hypothetical protein
LIASYVSVAMGLFGGDVIPSPANASAAWSLHTAMPFVYRGVYPENDQQVNIIAQ